MGNIWDDMAKGKLATNESAASAWSNLKQDRITSSDLLSPSPSKTNIIKANNTLPVGTISFDIETGSVDDMFKAGPEYMRLTGYSIDLGNVMTTVNARNLVCDINEEDGWVVGHNILNFDLIVLARHTHLNILELARKNRIIDTKLLAFLADPPLSRTKEGEIERMFSLDNTGMRYLGEGKVKDIVSGKSVLKELAKEFGGFDKIPQDHPKYVEYLKQDVLVTRELAKVIPINEYAVREHKINAICSVISIEGFRVDPDLLEMRIQEGEEKRLSILTGLQEYGLPGPETTKAPHRTKAGIAAIDTAFSNLGVTLPRTEKTGRPALGKEVLQEIADVHSESEVSDLAEAVMSLNGIRCVPLYSEILTRNGWKTYLQLDPCDETLGLGEDGKLHWTKITNVNVYDNADLINMSNNHFGVVCTPNHCWVTDHRYNSSGWSAENPGTSRRVREMREAKDLGSYDRIIVAAEADTERLVPISADEAGLIGWYLGDGYSKWNPNKALKSNYLVFNITQSKPEGVEELRDITHRSGLLWSEAFNQSNNSYVFTLKSTDATRLWSRCGFSQYQTKQNIDLTLFVMSLDSEQRKAFIHGFWGAEGHLVDSKNRVVTQMPGNIAEAIRLAVFLDGHRATRPNHNIDGADRIRCDAPPTITGEMLTMVPIGSAPVWCPTTELGTWVMRQGNQICLTGNSIYGNIHDNLVGDRVHPNINLRQSSGRLSITNPGLTVIGKRGGKVIERAVFLPDDPTHVLISCDLAQVDARSVAGLSQDTEYLKLFEPGRDLHAEMALRLFGTETKRERAKAVAHGINYGMQAKTLALKTGMSLEEAEDVVHNFEVSFPRLSEWQNEVRYEGQLSGLLYNGFGRLMRIEPERAFTQAPALMGQSTARDILMEGILRLWDNGGDRVIKMIRGIIHDELVMSVSLSEIDEIEKLVVESLSFDWCPVGGTHSVQIVAGLNKRGVNWADCYRKD